VDSNTEQVKLGIIGYGFRIRHMVDLMKEFGNVCVVSICDTDLEKAKADANQCETNFSNIRFFTSTDEFFNGPEVDGILVGTNCSSHAAIAVKVLEASVPLFLEKPVAITDEQLDSLRNVTAKKKHKAVVSFPLRLTPLLQKVKQIIDSGRIGTVEHVQAFNDVSYGHVYYQGWYRDSEETGGLFLQKATHDFDCINYLTGRRPTMIAAMTSKQVYKGNHPQGLYCSDCPENKTCKESPYNPDYIVCRDEWMKPEQYMCAFAVDAANEDSGSALIMYDSGMHAVYSQNFFVKQKAGRRGARLIGYDGTVEFDFHTNEIKLFYHHTGCVETQKVQAPVQAAHGGGDYKLAENFIGIIRGRCESLSTLEDGILSALMCLRAKESAKMFTFQRINY